MASKKTRARAAGKPQQPSAQKQLEMAGKLPAKARLLANLDSVSKEDRARAGITDEMANAMVEAQNAAKTGVEIVRGPFQATEDDDVIDQVRILDHDSNSVLFSGDEKTFKSLKKAIAVEEES